MEAQCGPPPAKKKKVSRGDEIEERMVRNLKALNVKRTPDEKEVFCKQVAYRFASLFLLLFLLAKGTSKNAYPVCAHGCGISRLTYAPTALLTMLIFSSTINLHNSFSILYLLC